MPRCRNMLLADDDIGSETIILAKQRPCLIDGLHESLIHEIMNHLDIFDIIRLKQSGKCMSGIINQEYIVDATIEKMGAQPSFCRGVFNEYFDLLNLTFYKQEVTKNMMAGAIIYAIHTFRNDIAMFLIDLHSYSDVSACRCCIRLQNPVCSSNCWGCCENLIKSNEIELSRPNLLSLACIVDNLPIAKFLIEKRKLKWTQFDINLCLKNKSISILEYLCGKKGAKICRSKAISHLNKITADNDIAYFEALVSKKIIKMGSALSFPLTQMLMYKDCNAKAFVKIIDAWGSHRLLRNMLKQAFHCNLVKVVEALLSTAKNIKITNKHLMYMDSLEFWKSHLNIELMLVNRFEMQKKTMQ